jgi:hypothetical protein
MHMPSSRAEHQKAAKTEAFPSIRPMHESLACHGTKTIAAAALVLSAFTLPSCSGKVAGMSERRNWLPAYTISAGEGSPSASQAYIGTDRSDIYGFNRYYPSIYDIEPQLMDDELRLTNLLLSHLSGTAFDFSSPRMSGALSRMTFAYMTDLGTWPNAIYSEDMGKAYGFLILDQGAHAVSDCSGDCLLSDLIAINNKSSTYPKAGSMDQLEGAERSKAQDLAESLSEELLHGIWNRGMEQSDRDSYSSLISALWSSVSNDEDGDLALASSWMDGGVPFAINSDWTLNNIQINVSLRHAITAAYPGIPESDAETMGFASISFLQVIGRFSSDFVGGSNRYLDYYASMDKKSGTPERAYLEYRAMFISREAYPHTGAVSSYSLIMPFFLRDFFVPQLRSGYLDGIFSDGALNPAISQNPYLQDSGSLASLAHDVIPPALGIK